MAKEKVSTRQLPSLLYRGFPNPRAIRKADTPGIFEGCRFENLRYLKINL
jgi:hypothetical protein